MLPLFWSGCISLVSFYLPPQFLRRCPNKVSAQLNGIVTDQLGGLVANAYVIVRNTVNSNAILIRAGRRQK